MPVMGAPPPAQDVQEQRGPFTMAAQQPQDSSPQGPQGQGGDEQGLLGVLIHATTSMREMLKVEPAMAPWVNDCISRLQSGVRTILGQRRQSTGGTMPVQSASPSNQPGAGLPF